MTILQLNPELPVFVEGKGNGYAFALIDYGQESYLYFAIAFDNGGDIWVLDNTEVKMQNNITLGRHANEEVFVQD